MKQTFPLGDFFAYTSLADAKEKFSDLLDTTVTGSFNKELSCRERCDMVFFIHQVEKAIEAAYYTTQGE
jgi:hypothetical protein